MQFGVGRFKSGWCPQDPTSRMVALSFGNMDDVGASLHCGVQFFERIGAADLDVMGLREAHEGQNFVTRVVHQACDFGELGPQLVGHGPRSSAGRFSAFPYKASGARAPDVPPCTDNSRICSLRREGVRLKRRQALTSLALMAFVDKSGPGFHMTK